MSWNQIMDGKGFTKGFPKIEITTDTYFSQLSENHLKTKITALLCNKKSILSLDTEKEFIKSVKDLSIKFGKFINKSEKFILIRGNLEFIKGNLNHSHFGKNLNLFIISNPFSSEEPIYLYSETNKIKYAGIFGEAKVNKLSINPDTKKVEAFLEDFFPENIESKIPNVIQDITDFDKVFTKILYLRSNLSTIKIGNSKEITSLQKLWMPAVSGESVLGQVEGINSYSLVSFYDSGSKLKESMDYFINYFQPSINFGINKLNIIDYDIRNKNQLTELTNLENRDILQGKYSGGFRANIGTVIKRGNNKRTKECINTIYKSKNTDYTNILDGLDVPTNLKPLLRKNKLLTGNFKFYLLSLKTLPVKYNISDIKKLPAKKIRIATSFAKLTPYLLDPQDNELMVPQNLKDKYLRAVDLFMKNNSNETQNFTEDHRLLN